MVIIPIACDGTKRPAIQSWKEFQTRKTTEEEIAVWFNNNAPLGIALVCGAISGNREVLDFDQGGLLFPAWKTAVEVLAPGLLKRLPIVRSPSQGFHVHLRSPGPAEGNLKCAWTLHPDEHEAAEGKRSIAIETRGEGGYVLLPGSPPSCHRNQALYVQEPGPDLCETPILTMQEREILFDAARSLNEICEERPADSEPPAPPGTIKGGDGSGLTAGTDFNLRGRWEDVLEPHGWTAVSRMNGSTQWRRPGKTTGISATCGHCRTRDGSPRLYVFSSNAAPFQAERSYSLFCAHAVLNFNGDFGSAAADLLSKGFGDPSASPQAAEGRALKEVQTLIEELRKVPTLERVFAAAPTLSLLGASALGPVKTALKEIFGKKLNLPDLMRAIRSAKTKREEKATRAREEAAEKAAGIPAIDFYDKQLREVTDKARSALEAANKQPKIFSRCGDIVRIKLDEKSRPSVQVLDEAIMIARLSRTANWFDHDKHGNKKGAFPPREVARSVLKTLGGCFQPLAGITGVPVFRPDGSLLEKPGYDDASGLFYTPLPGFKAPTIPTNPTRENIEKAFAKLNDLIAEFPFVDESSMANTLALMLTPVLKPTYSGSTPLCAIDGTKMGTGKTLLARVALRPGIGQWPRLRPLPREEEEIRKSLFAELLEGHSAVVFDNVEHPVASPSLAAVLTAQTWADRYLGHSRSATVPVNTVWAMTGNNLSLDGDLPRRVYLVRLDARTSAPWLRSGFRHENLEDWLLNNEGDVLGALLTLGRAWFAAGKPAAKMPAFGSFEGWASTVGGVLAHAGIEHFLGNADEVLENLADEETEWGGFLNAWQRAFGASWVSASQVEAQFATGDSGVLPEELRTIANTPGRSFARSLGRALRRRVGARFGALGLYLERRHDNLLNKLLWRVEAGEGQREPGEEEPGEEVA
jgi:hypothetical protein